MDPGERDDFATYVSARASALLRTAYLITGNREDAEDLLQTALAKTYLRWAHLREPNAADAYVRRVMLNTRTSWWRRRRIEAYPVAELPEPSEPSADGRSSGDSTGDVDLHDALWSALAGLPRRARAMVVLRYYEELTEHEVADALGVSVGTVKSTVSRALTRLRADAHLDDDSRAVPNTTGATA